MLYVFLWGKPSSFSHILLPSHNMDITCIHVCKCTYIYMPVRQTISNLKKFENDISSHLKEGINFFFQLHNTLKMQI